MPLNLPNLLTWLRIIMIPLVAAVFYLPDGWLTPHQVNLIAAGMFGIAAITDWLDGYLARILNQTSAFGAFLDPVADKLMVAAALIVLVKLGRVDALIALINHRSRNHYFRVAGMDGQHRRARQRGGIDDRQTQNRGANGRHPVAAIP